VLRDESHPTGPVRQCPWPTGPLAHLRGAQGWFAPRVLSQCRLPWPLPRNRGGLDEPSSAGEGYRSCGQVWASGKEPRTGASHRPGWPMWVWFGAMRSAASPAATRTHCLPSIGPQVACWCSTRLLATAGSLIPSAGKARSTRCGRRSSAGDHGECGQPRASRLWGSVFPSSPFLNSACIDAELRRTPCGSCRAGAMAGDASSVSQQPQI